VKQLQQIVVRQALGPDEDNDAGASALERDGQLVQVDAPVTRVL